MDLQVYIDQAWTSQPEKAPGAEATPADPGEWCAKHAIPCGPPNIPQVVWCGRGYHEAPPRRPEHSVAWSSEAESGIFELGGSRLHLYLELLVQHYYGDTRWRQVDI